MATKRMLYKPAQTNVGKKRNRRPLAQGRLVTAPSQAAPSGTRLQQGVVSEGHRAVTPTRVSVRDDPNATPRRAVPHVTEHRSPLPAPPIHSLDLSDSDDNAHDAQLTIVAQHTPRSSVVRSPGTQVPIQHVAHVMVLDASRVSQSPHGAEVDCVVGYERSPATVICHTQSTRSATPQEEGMWKVQVDQVPKVKAASPASGDTGVISPLSAQHNSSGSGGRETHAGNGLFTDDDIDNNVSRSSRRPKVMSARKKYPMVKLAQPSFEESGESDKTDTGVATKLKAASEVTSDSETCSLFEYVPQIKNRPKTTGSSHKPSALATKSEKKKKGERTVPSRYMQSAKSKKASIPSNISAEKSVVARRNLKLSASTNSNNSGSHSLGPTGGKAPNRYQSSRRPPAGASPDRGDNKGRPQGKTSTPTHDGVPVMASCDASAIDPELSMSAIDASHLRFGSGSGSGPLASRGSPQKQTKKVDARAQQLRLDMAYSRYLQWLLLDSKAACALQQQEKEAKRQLHALWELMEKTEKEHGELEREVAKLKQINLLDDQLEKQHRALEPVVQVLPTLEKDYSGLASALDTTRHQIPIHGVHLPHDQDFFLASLEQGLQESEQLLGTLATMTKTQAPAIRDFSDAIQAVEKAVNEECQELYKCGELLSAVQSLATHENSLRIQAIQSNR